jgi:hypothetical protein
VIAVMVGKRGALIWERHRGLRATGSQSERSRLLVMARRALVGPDSDARAVRSALLSMPDTELVVDEDA